MVMDEQVAIAEIFHTIASSLCDLLLCCWWVRDNIENNSCFAKQMAELSIFSDRTAETVVAARALTTSSSPLELLNFVPHICDRRRPLSSSLHDEIG